MPFQLQPFNEIGLDEALLRLLLDEHEERDLPALDRLWSYYRNPIVSAPAGAGRTRLAQEAGLPSRLRGRRDTGADDRDDALREIVIENDIAWRIHAMVDLMFGRPVALRSEAKDPQRRAEIERLLGAVLTASGGMALLQDMALLGSVYGHVDLLVRADDAFGAGAASGAPIERDVELAERIRIELIEAPRAIPLLDPSDYRRLQAMLVRTVRAGGGVEEGAATPRLLARALGRRSRRRRVEVEVIEIISASRRHVYEDGALVESAPNPLGVVPIAHIQNISQPFHYAGLSEVEPLIPLQDELNTRLSDRAHRVTMQSFKMYLAKGVESMFTGAEPPRVGPGQVWSTDNPEASVQAFGGDGDSPGEESHIEQVREAMDKASSVSPLAAGVIRDRIGNLSSENALRVTLMGMLAKTARKQVMYGRGLSQAAALVLKALDSAGIYRTSESERGVRIEWPEPLPTTERERLETALLKRDLGVARERVLEELGYGGGEG
ncbi:MAG: phage portal protein [Phycisphaeraceae bacterium]|nr:MAG: phage portal protein [Phycisphaeraceae bacterium]